MDLAYLAAIALFVTLVAGMAVGCHKLGEKK